MLFKCYYAVLYLFWVILRWPVLTGSIVLFYPVRDCRERRNFVKTNICRLHGNTSRYIRHPSRNGSHTFASMKSNWQKAKFFKYKYLERTLSLPVAGQTFLCMCKSFACFLTGRKTRTQFWVERLSWIKIFHVMRFKCESRFQYGIDSTCGTFFF